MEHRHIYLYAPEPGYTLLQFTALKYQNTPYTYAGAGHENGLQSVRVLGVGEDCKRWRHLAGLDLSQCRVGKHGQPRAVAPTRGAF